MYAIRSYYGCTDMGEQKRRSLRLPLNTNILASLISIGVGLIVGLILIYVLNAKAAGGAFISLITTGFVITSYSIHYAKLYDEENYTLGRAECQ